MEERGLDEEEEGAETGGEVGRKRSACWGERPFLTVKGGGENKRLSRRERSLKRLGVESALRSKRPSVYEQSHTEGMTTHKALTLRGRKESGKSGARLGGTYLFISVPKPSRVPDPPIAPARSRSSLCS